MEGETNIAKVSFNEWNETDSGWKIHFLFDYKHILSYII